MSESRHSRHLSWLVKSCIPNPQSHSQQHLDPQPHHHDKTTTPTQISSLPDDLLLECLSRVSPSSLPSLSLVCRRWSGLLHSPSFSHLRRLHGLLRPSLLALSFPSLISATYSLGSSHWHTSSLTNNHHLLSVLRDGSRLVSLGRYVYILASTATARFDTWTGFSEKRSPMLFPRKKFASSVVSGKIYVAGGASRTTAVEEYDPDIDAWITVAESPRKRYGCIGASVDGVFYIIGGLKIGSSAVGAAGAAGAEAHVYASSMDLYDVEARGWLRSRAVPGGGCVVAACAAAGHVYVLASHAVELSLWRFDARRKGGGGGFGEWCRMRSPPLPAQVRMDGSVRFSCVGAGENVVLVQVVGCIDDLLRRSGRSERGFREGLVLLYDVVSGEWTRAPDLPRVIQRAACVCVDC
ncbi:F-box domain [Dillenia turbinata]|uniref:F-box domain n=1 Tax=Dillenia turbinata TaxID=194707 RepID=A0AAN8ZGJ3_9MAGN